jgi:16S rRNA (cytidine1402-2'-O)-methyltransferase
MTTIKRQDLPAGLWIIATPIGNLEDLTPRALRVLQGSDLLFCEDTRRARTLLTALGVQECGKLIRLDAHTDPQRVRELLAAGAGGVMALVSDAGTPGISDPGAVAVGLAREAGIPVYTAPGVSAVATAVSICGRELPGGLWFRGFFPRKDGERSEALSEWEKTPPGSGTLWFESPERVQDTAKWLQDWGKDRPSGGSFFFKELTKVHERSWSSAERWVPEGFLESLQADQRLTRGEWGFMLFRAQPSRGERENELSRGEIAGAPWFMALQLLIECGVSVSMAAKQVSQRFGVKKKLVYDAALELSEKN